MMKNKKINLNNGCTLVEMIVVVAIFSVLLFSTAGFFIMTIQARGKAQTRIEAQEQARIAIERISYDIRRASGINTSNFGVNLALSSSSVLSLVASSTRNPTIYSVSNGILNVKYGTGSTTALTSRDVTVSNLVFTNLSSTNGRSKNILINMTLTKADPTGKTLTDVIYPVETTVEIMGK